jgi:hypothetical protein
MRMDDIPAAYFIKPAFNGTGANKPGFTLFPGQGLRPTTKI